MLGRVGKVLNYISDFFFTDSSIPVGAILLKGKLQDPLLIEKMPTNQYEQNDPGFVTYVSERLNTNEFRQRIRILIFLVLKMS